MGVPNKMNPSLDTLFPRGFFSPVCGALFVLSFADICSTLTWLFLKRCGEQHCTTVSPKRQPVVHQISFSPVLHCGKENGDLCGENASAVNASTSLEHCPFCTSFLSIAATQKGSFKQKRVMVRKAERHPCLCA